LFSNRQFMQPPVRSEVKFSRWINSNPFHRRQVITATYCRFIQSEIGQTANPNEVYALVRNRCAYSITVLHRTKLQIYLPVLVLSGSGGAHSGT
jgi:hypothetical protein